MKKISKLLFVLFMLVLSMNFVMADLIGPRDNRPTPTRPDVPTSENAISPTTIIIIGVVLAVVASIVVVIGLNKIKNDEANNTQVAFGAAPKPEAQAPQASSQEPEAVEEKENEEDEEIK